MTEQVLNVRAKPLKPARRKGMSKLILIVAAFLAAVAATLGYDAYYGRLGIIGPQPVIVQNGANRIIRVPPGGNVQAAIERAESGDIVELQAGAVYRGEIKLPNKPLTDFVTIQSSSAASLPPNERVSPSQSGLMATIVTGMFGQSAISTSRGAHHYRFVGIEFTPSNARYVYNLLLFGNGEALSNVPHHIEIDRSYIHPHKSGTTRRGIALNSANTTIKNSYIEGIAYPSEETQGICGWSGSKNIKIINNYIEGGAENIMFGGADPASADLIPSDIELRGNHLNKPLAWKKKVTTKTLFELKNAKRVVFAGNLLTNNWEGSALRVTVRNQDDGAPFSTIEDVTIRDNVIKGSGEGINILGKDDTYASQTLKRLAITNNLFLDIGTGEFDGSGYFVQVSDGDDISITNNTVFNQGNIATFHGARPRNFIFQDNITGHGNYGINGLSDMRGAIERSMFQNNLFINNRQVPSSDYVFPPDNMAAKDMNAVGFAAPAAGDYRLAPNSRYKGKGKNNTDIGCSLPSADIGR